MPTFGEIVVVDEFGIRPLCPASRHTIDLVREDAHGNRDRDIFDIEVAALVFSIETARRNRRVRQLIVRNVVQYIVSCKTFRNPVK